MGDLWKPSQISSIVNVISDHLSILEFDPYLQILSCCYQMMKVISVSAFGILIQRIGAIYLVLDSLTKKKNEMDDK